MSLEQGQQFIEPLLHSIIFNYLEIRSHNLPCDVMFVKHIAAVTLSVTQEETGTKVIPQFLLLHYQKRLSEAHPHSYGHG